MPNDTSPTEYVPDDELIAKQNDRLRRALPSLPPGAAAADGLRGRVLFTQAIAG